VKGRASVNPANFPFHVELQTRYSDVDTHGHINNVAVAGLYQEARWRVLQEAVYEPSNISTPWKGVVVRQTIDYLGEISHPALLRIGVGVSRIGKTSYVLSYALYERDECRGTCRTISVCVSQDGKAVEIPERGRERLRGLLIRAVSSS
jgi:acyl-CoA thioester hydrolase